MVTDGWTKCVSCFVCWYSGLSQGLTLYLRLHPAFFLFLPRLTWNCGPLTFSQVLELTICATMPNLAPVVLNCQDLVVIRLVISLYHLTLL